MALERVCASAGLLVDGDTRIATDPCEFFDEAVLAPVGCGRLRCASCGAWVRSGPPGLAIKRGASIETATIYATPSWAELAAFEQREPSAPLGQRVRFYACECSRWQAERVDAIDNDHDSTHDPDLPWACAGHAVPELPITLGQLRLATAADCAGVVSEIFSGTCPRALELPTRLPDGPAVWLGWLYTYLRNAPLAAPFAAAIADRIDDPDPLVIGRVLHFFTHFPRAREVAKLVAAAEADIHRVAIGHPIPEDTDVPTLWTVLAARLAGREANEALDDRVDTLVRRILVTPLASLSHADRGSTDLVELERQRRMKQGWDPSADSTKTWLEEYAVFKQNQRVDVVANELGRSPGAFNDPPLREFLAEHVLEIDAAAPGRWKLVLGRLADWLHKPEQGHLIVIAAVRLFESRRVDAAELRAWIDGCRRESKWVDDAWVSPIETMFATR